MDVLKSECWFRCEQAAPTSTHVSLGELEAYVARGRASTTAAALSSGRQVLSVSVKDGSQGDVDGLPCGARSLLIEADGGAIVCRGINKFFDISEVSDAWCGDSALWTDALYRVWAVRKMAGFVVTVFSLDGTCLEVMSKHVLAGPHVDAARQLLGKWGDAQRAQMAVDLFSWRACASFECIRRAEDHQHPVLEEGLFDQQLVLIAVQKRAQLREESFTCAAMPTIAKRWGVRSAPAVALTSYTALQDVLRAVEAWHSVYPPFTECPVLAEGFVLLIEVAGAGEKNTASSALGLSWCCPLRLKLKTPRYVVLRAFRSLVLGDSKPQTYLYHRGLLGWLGAPSASAVKLRTAVMDVGVAPLSAQFEASLQAKARVRYRGARDTVGHALVQLQGISARSANPRCHCALTVLVLCGLPGAGKTTVSKSLLQRLSNDAAHHHDNNSSSSSSFTSWLQFAVHVSRDVVSRDVALQHGIDEHSSKHKQRRLRALVHEQLCDIMRDVVQFCQEQQTRGLLIFDACNATHASRQVWRRCFPASLDGYQLLHVDCADAAVNARRAGQRDDHEVLRNTAEAQHALYTVRKRFQPPTAEELCWYVDTSTQTAADAAFEVQQRLQSLLTSRQSTEAELKEDIPSSALSLLAGGHPRVLTVASLRAELQESRTALLYSLLNMPDSMSAQLNDVASSLTMENKAARVCVLRIRLCCSTKSLRDMVASVLSPSLCLSFAATAAAPMTPIRPTSSLAAASRHFLRKVATTLFGGTPSADTFSSVTGSVARGHLKWLRGWLLHGKTASATSDVADALAERFEREASAPHVTLLHATVGDASLTDGVAERYLADEGLRVGEEVTVRLKTLLLDRHAVCFGVVLGSGQRFQGAASPAATQGERAPLHVTVATVDGTSAAYAGGMFALFDEWQSENEALLARQQASQQSVNRSQCKFHNFVEFQLHAEVELRGVIELRSE